MASTTSQKLKIKQGYSILTINAPDNFEKNFEELPTGVKFSSAAKKYQQIHWFVKNKAGMESTIREVIDLLKDDVVCWIYYPKGTSKIQTDLTRDKGRESLLRYDHLQWISLISFDNTWSAFGMRLKTDTDKKKEAEPKERAVLNWVDALTKTITLPEDLKTALAKAGNEEAFFNSLSFSNKKEYVEWIVTAKREKTRAARVEGAVERLGKKWKNPANR